MRRLFVEKIDEIVQLRNDAHAHLSIVLRAKKGDKIILCQGDGYDYTAVIEEFKKDETLVRVISSAKNVTEPQISADLFFTALKGDNNELVVQKTTELGIKNIYPMITRYCQVKAENIKVDRLNKIALQAAQQCGRGVVPAVKDVINFSQMLDKLYSYDTVVFPYENAKNNGIKTFLSNAKSFTKTAIIIGGEGGFSDSEAELLIKNGITPLTLGNRILRAETACISVTAIIMSMAGQLK